MKCMNIPHCQDYVSFLQMHVMLAAAFRGYSLYEEREAVKLFSFSPQATHALISEGGTRLYECALNKLEVFT